MNTVTEFWRERIRGTERARDISDACVVAIVGVLLIAVGVTGTWREPTGDPWWHALSLAAICGAMLTKRKHPLWALLAGCVIFVIDAVLGGSIGVLLGFLDLIYSAALFTAPKVPRRLAIGVGVVVVAAASATFISGAGVQAAALTALQTFAILGTPLWWGITVRQQQELAELAAARAADLQRLAELRETEAVREERVRMARDLHDALAGNLSAIALHSEAALAIPDDGTTAIQRDAFTVIRSASVASLDEMRSMVVLLRQGADAVTSPPRLAELDDLVESFRARGMTVTITGPTGIPPLPSAVDQAAYRIAQEALGNAARHAAGTSVGVAIDTTATTLSLTVTNARPGAGQQGQGTHGGGMGLTTMRERAEALGGTLSAGWTGDAWTVTALLPLSGARV